MAYANKTKVSPARSRMEIEKILGRYGADSFGYMTGNGTGAIAFEAHGRRIRITVPVPSPNDYAVNSRGYKQSKKQALGGVAKAERQRWRALALVVKAKLEAVECGVATFEEEFLPYILLPNGKTVGKVMVPQVAEAYKTKKMPPLLGDGT